MSLLIVDLRIPLTYRSYSIDFPWQDGEREHNQNCLCLGQFLSHLPGSFALSEYRIREHRKNIGVRRL